jgi:hypothetical protein
LAAIDNVKSAVEGALGKLGGGDLPPAKVLGGARVAIGLAGILTPGLTALFAGLKPGRNPSAVYLVRVNGASSAALGAGMLVGPAAVQPLLVQLGLATDVLGLLAIKRARGKGNIGLRAAVTGGVKDLALAGLGGAVLSGK